MSTVSGQTPGNIPQGPDKDFEQKVLKSEHPVLVVFLTPWSPPCRVMEKTLDEIILQTIEPKVSFVRMNADDHPSLSLWYEIREVPTLLLFVKGIVRARIVGTVSSAALLSKLMSAILVTDSTPHRPSGEVGK